MEGSPMSIRHMRNRAKVAALALAAAMLATAPAGAQFDQGELMKWASVIQVRYAIVGQFEGADTMIVDGNFGGGGYATVKDRAEIGLVWDQTTAQLVGKPTIRNFVSEVQNVRSFERKCNPPTLTGPYEQLTIDKIENGPGGALQMTAVRTYAAANAVQSCTGGRVAAPAKQIQEVLELALPAPTLLALAPESVPANMTVDRKASSMTVKKDNWTWTYKLSPVK